MADQIQLTRNEMQHSFQEWGVHKSTDTHVHFRRDALSKALSCLKEVYIPTKEEEEDLIKHEFPKEAKKAVEHVLRHELKEYSGNSMQEDKKRVVVEDKLKDVDPNLMLSFAPFYQPKRKTSAYTSTTKTTYIPRPEYKKCKLQDLDPLERFSKLYKTDSQYVFDSWFAPPPKAEFMGLCMEALVACHAVHYQSCHACKRSHALRWNGGGGSISSSWRDMVCVRCHATYEVKSKETVEKVARGFQRNAIRGGSFRRFCMHRNGLKKRGKHKRMFLVVVSRQWSSITISGAKGWPVQIVEIECVLPRLKPKSFVGESNMSLGCDIVSKLGTKVKWFDVPFVDVDFDGIGKRLFVEKFSEMVFERLSRGYVSDNLDVAAQLHDESTEGGEKHDVATLRSELENLKVGEDSDDDWEDSFEV